MFEKIKKHPHFEPKQFRDPRNIGLVVFGVLAIMVSWSGAKAIQANYELQKQISVLIQQNEVQKLENDNFKLKNEFLNTNEYLDMKARREFGLASPGEKVLIIPKSVAQKYVADIPQKNAPAKLITEQAKPWYQRNIEAWRQFLFN